jgi:serine/threonine protein kinase/WD40 repeat protein
MVADAEAIFHAVLDLSDTDRDCCLDRACAGNPQLRADVEALLRAHAEAGSFLEKGPLMVGTSPDAEEGDDNATQSILRRGPKGDVSGLLAPSDVPGSLGRLGHYEVQQVLGSGGFGTVLRAFDGKLQRTVAIKLIAPELAATSPARKRFLREAQACAAIRHENIVQIYNVEEQPFPYLVMEYIPGETLEKKLNEHGPLDVPEVLRLGWQMASGLAAAHARGLIHRDIKPANILLEGGPDDRVKITDFGLARAVDDASLTQSGAITGTPMYMAPEQALGATLDQRADLFSLGSVLYRMVSGRPPFRAETTLAVLKRVTEDTPRPIQEIIPETPDWLCAIISRLHAKRPDDRIQTAKELADLLAQCQKALELGTAPVLPWPVPVAEPSDSRAAPQSARPMPTAASRRLAGGLLASAAALLLLIVGLGVTEATGITNVRGTVIQLFSPDGTLVVEVDDPDVIVSIDGEEMVITGTGVKELRLKPGQYKVLASKDGKLVSQELVTVTRNGRRVVRVSREAGSALATGARPTPDTGTAPGHRLETAPAALAGSSPFDQLRAEDIPAEDRFAWQPKELVAVLGSYRQRHLQTVTSVALSADGRWVASGSTEHGLVPEAILWDRATMNRVANLMGGGVAFSPDSRTLACTVSGEAIHLYDLIDGKPRLRLRVPSSQHVWLGKFDASGERLYGFRESGLQRWQLTGGTPVELPAITVEHSLGGSGLDRAGHTAVLLENSIYHPQGGAAAVALVWDLRGEQPRQRFAVKYDSSLNTEMRSIAISPDGQRLATGSLNGHVHLWDISADAPKELAMFRRPGNECVIRLEFTPDGRSLLATANFMVEVLDVSQPVPVFVSRLSYPGSPDVLAVSPDGKAAVVGGIDQSVTLLSLEDQTLKEVLAPQGHRIKILSIEMARDGRTLLSSAGPEYARVWTFDGRRFVPGAQTPNRGYVRPGLITPDGDTVIVGPAIFRHDQGRLTPVKQMSNFPCCLSGDGKTLVDEGLGIFDLDGPRTQERLRLPAPKGVAAADLNADGSVLAVLFADDPHVAWWDLREKPPQLRQIPLDIGLSSLKWTPDGQTLIAAGPDGIVTWDWNQGEPRERERRVEPLHATSLAMAPDGLTFATSSLNLRRVVIWDTATLAPRREWTLPTDVSVIKFAPDGRHLLVGYCNGVIDVWRLAAAPVAAKSSPPQCVSSCAIFRAIDVAIPAPPLLGIPLCLFPGDWIK